MIFIVQMLTIPRNKQLSFNTFSLTINQMTAKEYLQNKKVLVMGLGAHGGGIATAKWLYSNGSRVTITDLRTKEQLQSSLNKFTFLQRKNISFILGEHRNNDFKTHDIIVVNPAIPRQSSYLKIAKEYKKDIQNDTSLFFRFVENPIIGVTGTRGKTTTTNWISHFLTSKYKNIQPTGNNPANPFLKEIRNKNNISPIVAELSSWQLELLPISKKAPHIAVITNIYPDHLNRYTNIKAYASAKANIFKHQTSEDFLILNYDNEWHNFFSEKKPRSQIYYISQKALPNKKNGLFLSEKTIIFQKNGRQKKILSIPKFEKKWGLHNIENLLNTLLATILFNPHIRITSKIINTLPSIRYRQELVYKNAHATFINDTTATSPDALISSLKRFSSPTTLFIVGGTDKQLPFTICAEVMAKRTTANHVFFLEGSATKKLLKELTKHNFFLNSEPQLYNSLLECVQESYKSFGSKRGIIVFSPGGSSFEKFKNEFHRGEMFEKYIHTL